MQDDQNKDALAELEALKALCQTQTVLLAEDDELARYSITAILSRFFKQVTSVQNGLDALEKYREQPYDILVTDISMPRMDGVELIHEIRKINPAQVVAVLTVHNDNTTLFKLIDLGVDYYLTKPLEMQRFSQVMLDATQQVHHRKVGQGYLDNLEQMVKERTGELIKAYDELKRADQMKDDFLEMISHELQTPLASICGYSEIIGNMELEPEKLRHFTKIIGEESTRLQVYIKDVLELAYLGAGKVEFRFKIVDLNQILQEAMAKLENLFALYEGIDVQVKVEEVFFEGDQQKLIDLFVRLVTNAMRYSPKHGVVWIKNHIENGRLLVLIQDQGALIVQGQEDKIFDRFFYDMRKEKPKTGAGLDLAIAQTIAKNHKGKITAQNCEQGGVLFTLNLPLSQA